MYTFRSLPRKITTLKLHILKLVVSSLIMQRKGEAVYSAQRSNER